MTIKEALKIAIKEEIKAYTLYTNTSKKIKGAATKAMLTELAEQEKGHQRFLESFIAKDELTELGDDIPKHSLGISEFLVASKELEEDATPQEVMIFAIKEEEKAQKFYLDMKEKFAGTEAETLFHRLAEEEKGHKIKLEEEYEKEIMWEN